MQVTEKLTRRSRKRCKTSTGVLGEDMDDTRGQRSTGKEDGCRRNANVKMDVMSHEPLIRK